MTTDPRLLLCSTSAWAELKRQDDEFGNCYTDENGVVDGHPDMIALAEAIILVWLSQPATRSMYVAGQPDHLGIDSGSMYRAMCEQAIKELTP